MAGKEILVSVLGGGLFTLLGALATAWFANRKSMADVEIASRRLELETEKQRVELDRAERDEERAFWKARIAHAEAEAIRIAAEKARISDEMQKSLAQNRLYAEALIKALNTVPAEQRKAIRVEESAERFTDLQE